MKKIVLLFCINLLIYLSVFSQQSEVYKNDSVSVQSKVEFFTFNGPYGTENNKIAPAIRFIVTVKNNSQTPMPNLGPSKRSESLNFYVNDKIENPVSLYNGAEIMGDHLLQKGQSDSYTWWIFVEDSYGETYTVQWQYCEKFSQKILVDMKSKTVKLFSE